MTAIYKHTHCLRNLREVERVVVSQPEDVSWPAEFKMTLLFCDACKRCVAHHEVKIHFAS